MGGVLAFLACLALAGAQNMYFLYPPSLQIDSITANGEPLAFAELVNFTTYSGPRKTGLFAIEYDADRKLMVSGLFRVFEFGGQGSQPTSLFADLDMTEANQSFIFVTRFLPSHLLLESDASDEAPLGRQVIFQLGTPDSPALSLNLESHRNGSGTVSIDAYQRGSDGTMFVTTFPWFLAEMSSTLYDRYNSTIGPNATRNDNIFYSLAMSYSPYSNVVEASCLFFVNGHAVVPAERVTGQIIKTFDLPATLNWPTGPNVVSRLTIGVPYFNTSSYIPGRFVVSGIIVTKGAYGKFFDLGPYGRKLTTQLDIFRNLGENDTEADIVIKGPSNSGGGSSLAIGVGAGVGGGAALVLLLMGAFLALQRRRRTARNQAYVKQFVWDEASTIPESNSPTSRAPTDPGKIQLTFGGPLSARAHEFDLLASSTESNYIDPALLPPPELLTDTCCLSKGSYGQVFVVRFGNEAPVALKVVSLLGGGPTAKDLYKEIALLSKLTHPNMVQLLAHSATDGKGYMVLELCKGTSTDMWLAPAVSLVVPDLDPLFAALGQHYEAMWSEAVHKAAASIEANGYFNRFASLKLWDVPLVASSSEGQKALQQAVRSLTLIPALEVARSLSGSAPDSPASSVGWRMSHLSKPQPGPLSDRLVSGVPQELQGVRVEQARKKKEGDAASVASSTPPPLQLAVQRPLLVLTVGPLVYSFEPTDQDLWSGDALFGFLFTCVDRLPVLSLYDRVRIATETWRAIDFLHSDPSKPPVLHSDIKPQNVLLTESLSARVADVGLSILLRPFAPGQMSYVSRPVEFGTIGGTQMYQDPYMTGQGGHGSRARFGFKNDVYSFGVLLLDLFPKPYELFGRDTGWLASLLEPIVQRCVAPWESRYSSNELLRALESLHDEALRRTGGESIGPNVSESIRQLEACLYELDGPGPTQETELIINPLSTDHDQEAREETRQRRTAEVYSTDD